MGVINRHLRHELKKRFEGRQRTVQYYNEKMKYKTVNRVNKLYALLSVTYRLVVDSRLVNTTIRNANHIGKLGEKYPNS